MIRNYPILFPELDIVIQEDGQQFHFGETTLTFYLAPGHTADGLMTVVEPLGILIAGTIYRILNCLLFTTARRHIVRHLIKAM